MEPFPFTNKPKLGVALTGTLVKERETLKPRRPTAKAQSKAQSKAKAKAKAKTQTQTQKGKGQSQSQTVIVNIGKSRGKAAAKEKRSFPTDRPFPFTPPSLPPSFQPPPPPALAPPQPIGAKVGIEVPVKPRSSASVQSVRESLDIAVQPKREDQRSPLAVFGQSPKEQVSIFVPPPQPDIRALRLKRFAALPESETADALNLSPSEPLPFNFAGGASKLVSVPEQPAGVWFTEGETASALSLNQTDPVQITFGSAERLQSPKEVRFAEVAQQQQQQQQEFFVPPEEEGLFSGASSVSELTALSPEEQGPLKRFQPEEVAAAFEPDEPIEPPPPPAKKKKEKKAKKEKAIPQFSLPEEEPPEQLAVEQKKVKIPLTEEQKLEKKELRKAKKLLEASYSQYDEPIAFLGAEQSSQLTGQQPKEKEEITFEGSFPVETPPPVGENIERRRPKPSAQLAQAAEFSFLP